MGLLAHCDREGAGALENLFSISRGLDTSVSCLVSVLAGMLVNCPLEGTAAYRPLAGPLGVLTGVSPAESLYQQDYLWTVAGMNWSPVKRLFQNLQSD